MTNFDHENLPLPEWMHEALDHVVAVHTPDSDDLYDFFISRMHKEMNRESSYAVAMATELNSRGLFNDIIRDRDWMKLVMAFFGYMLDQYYRERREAEK